MPTRLATINFDDEDEVEDNIRDSKNEKENSSNPLPSTSVVVGHQSGTCLSQYTGKGAAVKLAASIQDRRNHPR